MSETYKFKKDSKNYVIKYEDTSILDMKLLFREKEYTVRSFLRSSKLLNELVDEIISSTIDNLELYGAASQRDIELLYKYEIAKDPHGKVEEYEELDIHNFSHKQIENLKKNCDFEEISIVKTFTDKLYFYAYVRDPLMKKFQVAPGEFIEGYTY